jgi:hypothetical protein
LPGILEKGFKMRVVISASDLKEIVIACIMEGMYCPPIMSDSELEEMEDYINDTEIEHINIECSDLIINIPERI